MTFGKNEIRTLRKSLWGLSAALLLSGGIVYYTKEIKSQTKAELRNAQNAVSDARRQLDSARQDAESMSTYSIEYGALLAQEIIGEDKRLNWIEALEKIRQQNPTNDFRYRIEPQQPYTPNPALDTGNFDIRYSAMKLQFELLHEGQLVDFFAALRHDINGWYHLESCTLQRKSVDIEQPFTPDASARLSAECSGGWITLKNRNATP